MEQKQQPKNPAAQAGQNQPGQHGNQPGKQAQQGTQPKQSQPGTNPNRNEDFPGKAPDVYSNRNKDRAETPDAARKQGSPNDRSRDGSRQ